MPHSSSSSPKRAGVRAHRRLDREHVLAQGRRLRPFAEEGPGLRARKLDRHGWYPSPASGADRASARRSIALWRSSSSKAACRCPAPSCPPATRTRPCRCWPRACSRTEQVVLHNVPRIRDTEALIALLEDLGVKVERRAATTVVACRPTRSRATEVDAELAERIRAIVARRRPAAGPLRLGAAAAARRRRDRPPPAGSAPGRLPRARRARRARARHPPDAPPTAGCRRATSSWTSRP